MTAPPTPVASDPSGFRSQPRGVLAALVGILVFFVVVSAWNIGQAGYSDFYSSAARSMSESWRAFFFGAFDPASTITLDKLAGFLVPQALSVRLFGFHQWSLALPQVVEGLVTVLAVFRIACRASGATAGLSAAAALATTPLVLSMFGHGMEDGLLTMALALAFERWQAAIASHRLLPLIVSGLWIAVGFQAKMLQAWFVLPGLAIGLLFVVGMPIVRRIARAALFLAVSAIASVAWMVAVQLVPAGSRPYFDGSTNDNVFAAVFGYNGVNRFEPGLIPGAVPAFLLSLSPSGNAASRLLGPATTTQVGWLYPLALAGLVFAVVSSRRHAEGHRPAVRPWAIGLGLWLATAAAVLSVAPIPHTAYLAAVSVQIAVLAGMGIAGCQRLLGRGARLRARAVVALIVAVQVGWTVAVLSASRVAPSWLVVVVIALAALAVLGVLVGPGRASGRRLQIALATGGVAILLAPLVWTGSILDPALGGSANDAHGGPRAERVPSFFRSPGALDDTTSFDHFTLRPPALTSPDEVLSSEQKHLVTYLTRKTGGRGILLTTDSWGTASPYLIATGLPVMSLGGFSGQVPAPTLAGFTSLVRSDDARYVLMRTGTPSLPKNPTERRRILYWVGMTCTYVPDDVYEGATTLPSQSLWDCRGAAD